MRYLNNAIGASGETDTVKYLKKNKYKILERNYRNKFGEIDIIAKINDYYVFVEVKTRSTLGHGRPCEAVSPSKQHKIQIAAQVYLIERKLNDVPIRFDVIEVIDNEINHIINAF